MNPGKITTSIIVHGSHRYALLKGGGLDMSILDTMPQKQRSASAILSAYAENEIHRAHSIVEKAKNLRAMLATENAKPNASTEPQPNTLNPRTT